MVGVALETVTVRHERASAPKQVRISPRVRAAIDLMVFEGAKRPDAAQKAGITDHTLYVSLTKPHVLAYLNTQQGVLRTSASARSIARIDNLADESESDHVKLESNKFLLGIEGISPVAKSESINVHKHVLPGLTIMTGGWSPHEIAQKPAELLDITPSVQRIGNPVAHPSKQAVQPTTSGNESAPVESQSEQIT